LVGILGGETDPKLTKKWNKYKDNQPPNTPISFKRGINIRGGKSDDFSSPPKPTAALAAAAPLFQRKTYLNHYACHLP
jgi:hypothetical protein